jgi:hypothetical protein
VRLLIARPGKTKQCRNSKDVQAKVHPDTAISIQPELYLLHAWVPPQREISNYRNTHTCAGVKKCYTLFYREINSHIDRNLTA